MECPSPAVNGKFTEAILAHQNRRSSRSLHTKYHGTQLLARIGFIMDNVEAVRDLEKHFQLIRSQLLYVDDPKFFEFPNQQKLYKGDTLVIEVSGISLHLIDFLFTMM